MVFKDEEVQFIGWWEASVMVVSRRETEKNGRVDIGCGLYGICRRVQLWREETLRWLLKVKQRRRRILTCIWVLSFFQLSFFFVFSVFFSTNQKEDNMLSIRREKSIFSHFLLLLHFEKWWKKGYPRVGHVQLIGGLFSQLKLTFIRMS